MTPHVLIFGASGGIATALRHSLEKQHCHITAITRNPDKIQNPAESTHVVKGDATEQQDVRDAWKKAESHLPPTAVVNCLGNVFLKPVHRTSADEFIQVMNLHVFSSFLILNHACSRLSAGGSIALMSSVAARCGLPNHETISAAKGAVEGLVRSAAATYAPKNLRINAVAPGLVETPATAALCQGQARQVSEGMHPLGRIGQAADIASALSWLISPDQSWVTGQILHVDGGLAHLRKKPQ